MARVVLIADSETGELIDVAGNAREGGRYRKLVGRMLSPDGTQLNYGANGGSSLTISANGGKGEQINLLADTVNIPGVLRVGGKTVFEVASTAAGDVLSDIQGNPGQIVVTKTTYTDPSTGKSRPVVTVSLDPLIVSRINNVLNAVTKGDIASVVDGLSVQSDDSFETVRSTLGLLLERLDSLGGS